jgi:hypothetical protein
LVLRESRCRFVGVAWALFRKRIHSFLLLPSIGRGRKK